MDEIEAFGGNNTKGPIDVATAVNAKGGAGRMDFESETFVTHSLRGDGFDASEDGTGRGTPITLIKNQTPMQGMAVRRLTPTECERLQGFPDGYTLIPYRNGKPAADGPRYKALGNSMARTVMEWIGRRVAMVDAVISEKERLNAKR